eukprot:3902839-Prymnesium_polylepis.2
MYVYFSLRSASSAVTVVWVLQQLMTQGIVVMRNSGATDALTRHHMQRFFDCLEERGSSVTDLKEASSAHDPIFRLQFLARVGIQYDLANLSALIITPSIISFFIVRDGYFSLEGTGILIRECDLGNVWTRFGILLMIKPAASYLGRSLITRAMRRTIMGEKTAHGVSPLAAELMASRAMVGKKKRGKVLKKVAEKQMQDIRNSIGEAEFRTIRSELSLDNMDYDTNLSRLLYKHNFFFFSIICVQLFAAFPVRKTTSGSAVDAVALQVGPGRWRALFACEHTLPSACPLLPFARS